MRRLIAAFCACFLLLAASQVSFAGQAEVRDIQQQLTQMGYDPGPVDGAWGGKTESAARKFLGDKGLDEASVFSSGGRDDAALLDHIKSVQAAEKKAREEAALRAAKGFALVIGNAAYENTKKLANPVKDSALMAATLEAAGFIVTHLKDADQKTMKKAMRSFGRSVREHGKPSFFYYAGHAVQESGGNYLVPVSANIKDETEIEFDGVPMGAFMRTLEKETASLNMVVFDTYHRNPYREKFTSAKRGLVSVDAPKGTYIVLASSPDQEDAGKGKDYSPYTWALANAILTPGLPVEEVFKKARADLLATAPGLLAPYEVSSVTGEFWFLASSEGIDKAAIIAASKQYESSLSKYLNRTFLFSYMTPCCGMAKDRVYISQTKKVYWDTQSSGDCQNTGAVGEINSSKKFKYSCNVDMVGVMTVEGNVIIKTKDNEISITENTITSATNVSGKTKGEAVVKFKYIDGKCELLRRTWLAVNGKKQIATRFSCHTVEGRPQ